MNTIDTDYGEAEELDRIPLSSDRWSHDDQVADVISYLSNGTPEQQRQMDELLAEFPEYNSLEWSGSWIDTEASGVAPEYSSWLADWLEANTAVYWEDGEPWLPIGGDDQQ